MMSLLPFSLLLPEPLEDTLEGRWDKLEGKIYTNPVK